MTLTKPFPIQNASISFGADTVYRLVDDLMSAGVVGSGDFAVSQRAAGANMSVDVATGTAVVAFTSPYGGKRRVVNDAVMNSGTPGSPGSGWTTTFTSANGTNPRIDRVVLTVRDSNLDASGNYDAVLAVVSGTATSGANLTNLTGAAAVPSNSLLLANVLIPAGSSSITTGNIDTTVRPRATVGSGNAPTAYTGPTYATTLPGSPVDGQQAILVDSLTNPSYHWTFRYNASSSSAYKWEAIGTTPILTSGSTSSISVTCPRAGEYEWSGGGHASVSSGGDAGVVLPNGDTYGTGNFASNYGTGLLTRTAAATISISRNGTTSPSGFLTLSVRPIRVS